LGISAMSSSNGTPLMSYDYVALVNNDATATPGWLTPLVAELEKSPDVGAASPKILLAPRFIEIEMSGLHPTSGSGSDEQLCVSGIRVDGQRCDDRLSFDEGFTGTPDPVQDIGGDFSRWTRLGGCIRVIAGEESSPHTVSVRVGARVPGWIGVRSDQGEQRVRVGAGDGAEPNGQRWIEIETGPERIDVINNAGSELYRGGSAGDRGFLERDRGQYDEPAEIQAWCGGAVLLRKEYLDAVGLFDESFFLYYEDTDLSWRGLLQGWRYRYVPQSVVRHRHAQSSGVGSDLFRFQVERNRLLVLAKNAPGRMVVQSAAGEFRRYIGSLLRDVVRPLLLARRPRLREFRFRHRVLRSYLRRVPGALGQRWLMDRRTTRRRIMKRAVDKVVRTPHFEQSAGVPRIDATDFVAKPKAAVYNLYWDTYGGGEMVSGRFAVDLARDHEVTLLGPQRPDVEIFRERLGIDLSSFEWREVAGDGEASLLSGEFDLFVNCAYLSAAVNRAPVGLYYVHFPDHVRRSATTRLMELAIRLARVASSLPALRRVVGRPLRVLSRRLPDTSWTDSYSTFIANSAYTQTWIQRIWNQPSRVVHPPVSVPGFTGAKEPIIASVGRFFDPARGHSKKQLELVRTFGAMSRSTDGVEPWRLVLVGGADAANRDYVMRIRREAKDLPVEVNLNAGRGLLESVLARAEIYWHAGGFGEDEAKHPERFEHFGISVVEAMAAGAVPVVFGAAGPAEIVRHGVDGFHWRTLQELQTFTRRLMSDPALRRAMSENARRRVADFSEERFAEAIRSVVSADAG
ncbi:MAG: glycosyltransferase, partial [Actinomycetota bacterium]